MQFHFLAGNSSHSHVQSHILARSVPFVADLRVGRCEQCVTGRPVCSDTHKVCKLFAQARRALLSLPNVSSLVFFVMVAGYNTSSPASGT